MFAIENGLDFILCEAFVVKHAIFLSFSCTELSLVLLTELMRSHWDALPLG